MAKLYFRYGAVGSAKTHNLIAVAHNYTQQGKKVVVMKPAIDTRFGVHEVQSRSGLCRMADVLLDSNTQFDPALFHDCACILVDEVQFLSTRIIDELRNIVTLHNIPVICYGLRTDFRLCLFDGSRRLLEVADTIEEVKTTCAQCNRKATCNKKMVNGISSTDGPQIELGCEEIYIPVCHNHYLSMLNK